MIMIRNEGWRANMIVVFTSIKDGGILQLANQVVDTLLKLGYECKLMVPKGSMYLCADEFRGIIYEYEDEKTINIRSQYVRRLVKTIEGFSPEVFIAVDDAIRSNMVVHLLNKKIRTAVFVHDVTPHLQRFSLRKYAVEKIRCFYRRGAFSSANLVVVLSEHSKSLFCQRYRGFNDKCAVLPLGAHLIPAEIKRPPELGDDYVGNYALFFGRIDRYKGVDRLIEAYNDVCNESDSSLSLVIAGKTVVGEVVPTSSHKKVCIINRYISDGEIQFLFEHCRFVVLPYYEASQSGVLPIAYKFGKPVIVSAIPGLQELVVKGKTGLVFSDENELKESIRALADPDKVLFSQDEIKELYDRHYNWNKNLARILDCIFD